MNKFENGPPSTSRMFIDGNLMIAGVYEFVHESQIWLMSVERASSPAN